MISRGGQLGNLLLIDMCLAKTDVVQVLFKYVDTSQRLPAGEFDTRILRMDSHSESRSRVGWWLFRPFLPCLADMCRGNLPSSSHFKIPLLYCLWYKLITQCHLNRRSMLPKSIPSFVICSSRAIVLLHLVLFQPFYFDLDTSVKIEESCHRVRQDIL